MKSLVESAKQSPWSAVTAGILAVVVVYTLVVFSQGNVLASAGAAVCECEGEECNHAGKPSDE